jgi:hypothetical protein
VKCVCSHSRSKGPRSSHSWASFEFNDLQPLSVAIVAVCVGICVGLLLCALENGNGVAFHLSFAVELDLGGLPAS